VLLAAILALLALVVDISIYGPITNLAGTTLVVAPAERAFGFHAEWRTYTWYSRPVELLTIVSVTPGGAFERAGMKPGFAFAPYKCSFGMPYLGGPHSQLVGRHQTVRLGIVQDPKKPGDTTFFEVRPPAA
jgi:hypothetical protein